MNIKRLLCSGVLVMSLASTSLLSFAQDDVSENVQEITEGEAPEAIGETEEPEEPEAEPEVVESYDEYDEYGNLMFASPSSMEEGMNEAAEGRMYARAIGSQQSFINQIAPLAEKAARENDMYASVMIAQAICESGWGGSSLSKAPNYNLFGIKGSYNGQSVMMLTSEYDASKGGWYQINAAFRKYPSYRESLLDNVHVIRTTSFQSGVYYYSGAWKSNTKSYKEATDCLKGRYATSPTYNTTLNRIIEEYGLTKYDKDPGMYRLYNPGNYEHFYTASATERDYLVQTGWGTYEGVAWYPPKTGTPVYRLYNPVLKDHHYTTDWNEVSTLKSKHGWNYEDVAWNSGGTKTVYRLFNPGLKSGSHHYTLDQNEVNVLKSRGWKYEGIAWYGE